jgi:hypothetical protein
VTDPWLMQATVLGRLISPLIFAGAVSEIRIYIYLHQNFRFFFRFGYNRK